MPSAVFSVAMASSFNAKRNAFSSNEIFFRSALRAAAGSSLRPSGSVLAFNSASRGGAMVSRSQPASSVISPRLRNEAPMTSVV